MAIKGSLKEASLPDVLQLLALGKKSGLANIKIKLDELGLNAPAEKHAAILEKVKSLGTAEKRLVTDQEFRAMVADFN